MVPALHASTDLPPDELRRQNSELRRINGLLAGILESVTESFIAVDSNWRFTYANPRVAAQLGRTEEALIGTSLWEAAPDLAGSDFELQYRMVMRERRPVNFETYYKPRGKWYDVHAFPAEGGIAAYVIDTTARKRAEQLVLADEAVKLSDQILNQLPDAILVTDLDGNIHQWLGGAEQMFGYAAQEALGRPVDFLHLPELRDDIRARILADIERSGGFFGEVPCVHKNGARILVETKAKSVLDDSGQPLFLVSINRDVTKRKQTEESLKQSEAKLAEAQQLAHLGSWEWDVRENKVAWSAGMYRIYGLEPHEFRPSYESFLERVHPEDRADTQRIIQSAFDERGSFDHDHRIICPDGSVRTLQARGQMSLDEAGHPIRMVGTAQDITERKRIEEEIRRLNAGLEKRVEERTADLQRSNDDLQQFAYVSSHDLQEPLRTIISYTQLLEKRYRDRLDAQADEFIGFVVEGAQRMSALIADLLAYSRVTNAGPSALSFVDVEAVVASVTMSLTTAAKETGAEIRHDPLPTVCGDEYQLIVLFQNLIANAIKYRGADAPQIRISAERSGQDWLFSVHDNGIGIETEYRERIFGLFKRLHGRDVPGTGLGLAICKKVVERHGGRIWVESQPRAGSTFRFTLPEA
ncbi:MAG: PAS domain S-box protein [Bryobacteraceae bacterium]